MGSDYLLLPAFLCNLYIYTYQAGANELQAGILHVSHSSDRGWMAYLPSKTSAPPLFFIPPLSSESLPHLSFCHNSVRRTFDPVRQRPAHPALFPHGSLPRRGIGTQIVLAQARSESFRFLSSAGGAPCALRLQVLRPPGALQMLCFAAVFHRRIGCGHVRRR